MLLCRCNAHPRKGIVTDQLVKYTDVGMCSWYIAVLSMVCLIHVAQWIGPILINAMAVSWSMLLKSESNSISPLGFRTISLDGNCDDYCTLTTRAVQQNKYFSQHPHLFIRITSSALWKRCLRLMLSNIWLGNFHWPFLDALNRSLQ